MKVHIIGIVLCVLGSTLFGMLLGAGAEIGSYHFRAKVGMVAFVTLALIGIICIGP
jgi:hypothetical protein